MRYSWAALWAVLMLSMSPHAFAQSQPVYQSGTMSPHHLPKFLANGKLGDVGGLTGDVNGRGVAPFSVQDNLGLGQCFNSAATAAGYRAFCLGHDASGNALLTVDSYGGAAAGSLRARINGVEVDLITGAVTGFAAIASSGSASDLVAGTVPSARLVAIPNASLANSSLSIAGHSVSLGGSATVACADLSNGATGCSTATGTSGATIPLLSAANTWSGAQSFNSGDLVLKGATSGTLTINAASVAGTNTITFPAGSTNFAGTGGTSQVVKQSTAGGGFTVARVNCADLTDATTGCSGDASGLTSGTLPQARLGASQTACTPTDASGAALTFTSVSCHYDRIGNLVFVYFQLTYPVTADGTAAKIGGLPVTVANANYAAVGQACIANAGANTPVLAQFVINTTTVLLLKPTSAGILNSDLSTDTVRCAIWYPAA